MALPPLPGGPRHVGRVIDPAVSEGGDLEPIVELEAQSASHSEDTEASSVEPPLEETQEIEPATEASPRRDAAEMLPLSVEAEGATLGDLDEIGAPEPDALTELEQQPPGARAPAAPFYNPRGARLSPGWVAVFATLLGIASVASLTALGMNLDVAAPHRAAPAPVSPSAATPLQPHPAPAEPARAKRVRQKMPGPWRVSDGKAESQSRWLEGKIEGDAFLKAMEKAGIPPRETYRVMTAMKGVRDFDRCKRSDRFVALLDRSSSRLKAFEYIVGPEEVYQAKEGPDGLLKGVQLDLKVAREQIAAALVHDGKSFDGSAERAGLEAGLARVVTRSLDGHLGLEDLERGDRVRILLQEVTVLGEFARYAGIEAIEIQPAAGDRKPLRVYYFDSPGERGYYDGEGRSPYDGGWRKPIKDAPMTSPFNLKRKHPILKKVMPHLGIDFGAPTGTPVGAASSGTVTFAGFRGPTGNLVKIAHAGNIETGYAHLSRFAEGLKVGDRVKRLQVIGYVGSTGRSTGPHLHFSATRNREFIDPATLNMDAMRTVSKASRETFALVKAKYDAALDAIPLPQPLPPQPSEPTAAVLAPAAGAPTRPVDEELQIAADDEEELGGGSPQAAAAVAPAAAATGVKPGSAVYLTDKELLELQGATDEGEVME